MLFINKPAGITSHDVVDIVRKKTGVRRVGHTGTLDPFAEGLLIVLVGREETKKQSEYLKLDKEYIATIHLGAESDTGDKTGKIKDLHSKPIDLKDIKEVLTTFTGEIEQMPPEYSAIKIRGKKAYELAREGKKVELTSRKITIHSIEIMDYAWPMLTIKTHVSSGTYIRALARDIGKALGTGAYVEKLARTKIGEYTLDDVKDLHYCM